MALKLGDIEFLNSWPVTYALKTGIVAGDISLVQAPPAQLNRWLLTGELDASAVSSILYLRHMEEFVPIPGLCIRSDSGVHSVLVVSRQSLESLKAKTIGVSNQGATTPVLLKLLLKKRNLRMRLEPTSLRYPEILDQYPAALLIGDEALQASQSENLHVWDLGEAWSSWVKLPAVFALWVVRKNLLERRPRIVEELKEALDASCEWGRDHQKELIAQMRKTFPFEATFLKKYLNALSYDLDAKAWAGLKRFALEAERLGELPKATARKVKLSTDYALCR